jgi:molybdate/tungstate transport system substrate-binding protein
MRRFTTCAAVLFISALVAVRVLAATQVVQVLYAGSMVTPMEGPIKTALAQQGIDFQGQGGGSKMLANLIAAGDKRPDIFISVDPKIVLGLGSKILDAETFASTSLGIGWSKSSKHAAVFDSVAAGKTSIVAALSTPGIRIGRTDPKLDPKGVYTVEAMTILAGADGEERILGVPENDAQIFPEEDLLARIDTGQIDVGFFYRTEAVARGLNFVPLPGKASMSDTITYTIADLRDAPHPTVAAKFEQFLLNGQGKTILQRAGVTYLPAPVILVKRS